MADTLKLARTIRLDPSDTLVFARAAAPGEWAVSGAFMFLEPGIDMAAPKVRTAFRSGLLGVESLGWSTLAVVVEATMAERDAAIETLAAHLLRDFGAPDAATARAAAVQEIAFAASLCDHPAQTLLAVERSMEDGAIRERFRTLKPKPPGEHDDTLHAHARAFTFHAVEGEDEPVEEVDLLNLMKAENP
jgi:Family of unknown function (DUF6505)